VRQKFYYFDYKKSHEIVWLIIIYSNDLIESIYDFCEDKINDVTMLQKFELQNRLKTLLKDRRKLQLYNDKIYIYQSYIMSLYLDYTNER